MSEENRTDLEIEETEAAEKSFAEPTEAADNSAADVTSAEEKKPTPPPHKEYSKRMAQFGAFYIQLLCCIGGIIAVGVALAIVYSVVLGASIAVAGALLYAYLTSDEMYKKLGIRYTSGAGGITVTLGLARYGDVLWIPSRLIFFDVIRIGDRAFCSKKNEELSRVFLPKTLKSIGKDIFEGCPSMTDIFFEGTQDMWEEIEKSTDLSGYRIIFEAKYPPAAKKKKTVSGKSRSKNNIK